MSELIHCHLKNEFYYKNKLNENPFKQQCETKLEKNIYLQKNNKIT